MFVGWICDPRTETWTNVCQGSTLGICHRALNRWVRDHKPRMRDNLDACITHGSYPQAVDRRMK